MLKTTPTQMDDFERRLCAQTQQLYISKMLYICLKWILKTPQYYIIS